MPDAVKYIVTYLIRPAISPVFCRPQQLPDPRFEPTLGAERAATTGASARLPT